MILIGIILIAIGVSTYISRRNIKDKENISKIDRKHKFNVGDEVYWLDRNWIDTTFPYIIKGLSHSKYVRRGGKMSRIDFYSVEKDGMDLGFFEECNLTLSSDHKKP